MKAWITEQPDNNILETWEKWCTDNAPVHFFQHPAFAKLVIGSGVYQHGLAVALEDGQSWSAVLSYVILHEHGRAFRRLTTRTLVYGGPVFATDLSENEKSTAVATLLNSLNSHLKNRCLYIQFRNFSDHTPFEKIFASFGYRFTDRLNLLKPIEDPAQAFQALSASRRRQVRLSRANGLIVRPAQSLEEIDLFYAMLQELYRDKVRKPLPPPELFRQFFLLSQNRPCGRMLIAEYQGRLAGGIVAPLTPGGSIFEWYVCGLDKAYRPLGIYPSVALTWAAMEAGIEAGCHTFDFMGMGVPYKPYGVRDFKARFGGNWVNHGRWMRINHPLSYRLVEIAYNLMRRLKKV